MELSEPNNQRWAGMPGKPIDDNSLQQHIEFPTLLDDEFEEFSTDRTGWTFRKQMPRLSNLLKPMAALSHAGDVRSLARVFSTPDFQHMIEQFKKINAFYIEHEKRAAEVVKTVEELGYPNLRTGMAGAPFDSYSNFMRGTILSLSDLYDNPEFVLARVEEYYDGTGALKAIGTALLLIIASIVLAENGILVTNNTKEFSRIAGLQLENWTN